METGLADKNQHNVMGITGKKVKTMYQMREKFCSLNSLMTSSGSSNSFLFYNSILLLIKYLPININHEEEKT